MVHSVFHVQHSRVVPVVKSQHDQRVPPLMGGADVIHPSLKDKKMILVNAIIKRHVRVFRNGSRGGKHNDPSILLL